MDASVLAAIARWPNVPDVYGWLGLTARGQWRLQGEPIGNWAINEFIGRNYAADARGCWFFQNGPQRVFVALELAPWVLRVQPDGSLRTHTGLVPQRLLGAALVDGSAFVLHTDLGAGNVDDRDAGAFLPAVVDEHGRPAEAHLLAARRPLFVAAARCRLGGSLVPLQAMTLSQAEAAFGFRRQPNPG